MNVDTIDTIRRLPAYGKSWVQARSKGLVPAAGVFGALVLLDHWDIEPAWPRLVIPRDMEPEELDYRVLAGLDVTLAYWSLTCPDERLLNAVDAILRDGARIVATLDRSCRDRAIIRGRGHEH